MMNGKFLIGALLGTSLLGLAAPAGAQSQTFLDLQAGLGYSTNPELRPDGAGSGFGRVSAYGSHSWNTERSYTSLSAYVENNTYFRRYGNRQLFRVAADSSFKASETVNLSGSLGFSGDFGAQLGSRFFSVPQTLANEPPIVVEAPLVLVTPDLAAINQRQYRLNGNLAASFVLSPRESLTASFGAQRVTTGGNGNGFDYNQFDAATGYSRQVNERWSFGVQAVGSFADYSLGRSILLYGPQLTAAAQLNENVDFRGSIGFLRSEQDPGGLSSSSSSTNLSLNGALCRNLEYERMCLQAGRQAQSSVLGASPVSTSLGADYYRRLNARDQIQASVGVTTTGRVPELGLGRQTYFTAASSFDRKISDRLSAGVNVLARRLNLAGPDPKTDVGGSIFIRNRFGSVR
jgi:hypothetical protein